MTDVLVTVHISRDPEAVTGARFTRDFEVESKPVRRARVAVWDDRAPRVPGDGWGIWMRPIWSSGRWSGVDPCADAEAGGVHGPAAVMTVAPAGARGRLEVGDGFLVAVRMTGDGHCATLSLWPNLQEAQRHVALPAPRGWTARFAALGWSGSL